MYGIDNKLTVRVEKQNLLDTLKSNKIKHYKDYQKAKKGFITLLRKELKDMLEDLDNGHSVELRFDNTKPQSFINDYDEVIEMLEMSVDTQLEVTHEQFKKWVKDDWDWKSGWSSSNSIYLSAAG